ncbi:MAG: CotH kinase family protein, partial [Rhodothermales bacterium]|nr:CotH kinase family protein [Rhodothermales bacterium]
MTRLLLTLACALAAGTGHAQTVLVNEFMAANDTTIADPEFGDYSDWLELYNPGPTTVDLGGYFLTDEPSEPTRWRIPDGISIEGGGHLVFWADGANSGMHTSFRLSAEGEWVGVFDPSGGVVDLVGFGPQSRDISFGRSPDGGAPLRFFGQPTPGSPNATGYLGVVDAPDLSRPAGFHQGPTSVTMTTDGPSVTIRFTTDGSLPTESSTLYTGSIPVPMTSVVRAAAFADGYIPSPTVTRTYLIGEPRLLPVVSLSTDPSNFFDDEIGIYVAGTNGIPGYCRTIPLNWNQDWERPIHVEFFEPDGTMGFAVDAGVKIHGGCTRIYPQKSLAIFARREYGHSRIEYPVFGDGAPASLNNLVLRSSAQDWWRTMFRDGMIQTVIESGMDLETQAYRPAVVFLNGEYWGIHNLREKQNEHYLADHFGVDPDAVEILEGDKADVLGQSSHYDAMMNYMLSSDMTKRETLEQIDIWMDVDNYIDYLIAEIYSANADWPGNNLKFWRPTTSGGRWRWMIFDMDFGFGGNANGRYTSNTLALATDPNGSDWPNPPWSTLLLRTLLESPYFRDEFIQRFAVHANTTFEPTAVLDTIDSLRAVIAQEIPRHKARWP